MKVPPLATLLSTFFLRYLAMERGVSSHTSASYRDAIKLMLQFSATQCKRSVDHLVIEDLNAPLVLEPASGTTAGTYSFTNNSGTGANNLIIGSHIFKHTGRPIHVNGYFFCNIFYGQVPCYIKALIGGY